MPTVSALRRQPILAAGVAFTVVAAVVEAAGAADVVRFVLAGLALAALAAVIGQALDRVGDRVGSAGTGLLNSTLGNLPELFVGLFALHDGLLNVLRAALVGSILGTAVLVLGCAFIAGGLRHGPQRFAPEEPRLYAVLLLLAVAAMLVPTLAFHLDTPAAAHVGTLSDIGAVVLLVVYACSIPFTLRLSSAGPVPAGPVAGAVAGPEPAHPPASSGPVPGPADPADGSAALVTAHPGGWPFRWAVVALVVASGAAVLASDWFVGALEPATHALGINQAFTGLVIVALASNAVEHAVGVRFAWKAKPSYALSATLSSPLQVALLLTPALVLLSHVVGSTPLTLVFPPLLVAALAISAIVVLVVIYDAEYTWIEGVALVALYVMIAAAFWWG